MPAGGKGEGQKRVFRSWSSFLLRLLLLNPGGISAATGNNTTRSNLGRPILWPHLPNDSAGKEEKTREMVALGVLGTGCFEKSKDLKRILLFSEIFERSVGGGTLNYSLAIPASPSPLLFGFLRSLKGSSVFSGRN